MSKNPMNKTGIKIGLNKQTADFMNELYNEFDLITKKHIKKAIAIGEVLSEAKENVDHGAYLTWLDKNANFNQCSARRFVLLFKYKEYVLDSESLSDAYMLAEKLNREGIEKEEKEAIKRVDVYNKTGKKPEGWRRGTDDRLAKERKSNSANCSPVNNLQAVKKSKETTKTDIKVYDKNEVQRKLNLDHSSAVDKKTVNEKKEIKENDPFIESIVDYIKELPSKSHKMVALKNIIRECHKLMNDLY